MRPTLLFIHGLGSRGGVFDLLRAQPFFSGYTGQAPDLPGYGPQSGELVEDVFETALAFLENYVKKIDGPLAIVGHSMGGALGLLLNERLNEKVVAFVSLEGTMISEDYGPVTKQLAAAETDEAIDSIRAYLLAFARSMTLGWQEWADDIAKLNAQTFRNYARDLVAQADTGRLPELFNALPCPKLYIHGDRYETRVILKLLPEKNVRHVPEAGHFLLQDQPALCAQLIETVLAQV